MADFSTAYAITRRHEGGYSDLPDDRGGETFKGVSRKNFPHWIGWQSIDRAKGKPDFLERIMNDEILSKQVVDLFRDEFWHALRLSEVSDQRVADELFDTAVNMSPRVAAKFLQRGLNFLNRNGSIFADISDDGAVGEHTLNALRVYLSHDSTRHLLKTLNVQQGARYMRIAAHDHTQETFARGWLNRVEITRSSN